MKHLDHLSVHLKYAIPSSEASQRCCRSAARAVRSLTGTFVSALGAMTPMRSLKFSRPRQSHTKSSGLSLPVNLSIRFVRTRASLSTVFFWIDDKGQRPRIYIVFADMSKHSSPWFSVALVIFLGQLHGTTSTVIPGADNFRRMEAVGPSGLNHHPRATLSDFSLSSTLVETVSLSTSLSASFFISDGLIETTSIPVTLTFASLVPYLPSESLDTADLPSESPDTADLPSESTKTPKSSLPILPIAAGGGGLVVVILGVIAWLLCRRRRRRAALRRRMTVKGPPDLDSEMPRGELAGSRTFSRLTYTAPYTVPRSAGTLSTAAPSTVSIGQQYRTAPRPARGRER